MKMFDEPENLKEITTKLPSFLEVLLQEKCNIKLVYSQKNEIDEKPHIKREVKSDNYEEITENEFELTGTPLMTDLGGNDSICEEVISTISPSWSSEEAKYHPISLKRARTYLNLKLREFSESMSRPIYCLCDGNDTQNTLALGMMINDEGLMRIAVYILPCYHENHEITSLSYMKKDHINNVRRNAEKIKIQMLITKCYHLWGYNLKNCSLLQNAENNGFVAVETASIEADGKIFETSKMILQAITGHSNSPIKSFWEEMTLIQSYINLLTSSGKLTEGSVISENNYLDCEEITSLICDLMSNVNCFKKEASETLDLKNLRQESALEKLWHILKHCRKLSDLRDSLHFLFEELLEIQTKIQIFSDDMSMLAEIVNGLVEGKIAVPSLGFTQCLELLVDLGLEKLKNDYLCIINSFCRFAEEPVMKRWRDLCSENVATTTPTNLKRKSRISINPMSSIIDLSKNRLKLLYVDCMHKVAELMFLYKAHVKFCEESFDHFCEALCSNFLTTDKNLGPVCDVSKPRLCEFTFNLLSTDNDFEKELPATWLVKMTTIVESSEVTTAFYFSDYPIFPPSLFDNYYDVSFNNSNVKSWYVAKLVKYFGNC